MQIEKIAQHARALYDAHGDKAEAEAAQKAKQHEEAGESEAAETWRAVQKAIRQLRGANES
ncbi:hypothetical protein [Salibaculum griseiflavum]|jgi:hypothetical protein|uniref:Uncharacterized protein n=1 Tax=Salibaculum griseiflavum TaxID=1914409 RepID=A0A2V1P9U6_9RHOB|nr:hypothetical protein [Salibaculum griseiflavum]NBD30876.1 hypothetical protein [Alphaproteobacteria bacterium]PWG18518.1 hypothetical protein DFK10_00935 [Salibaculum griseiflavum]